MSGNQVKTADYRNIPQSQARAHSQAYSLLIFLFGSGIVFALFALLTATPLHAGSIYKCVDAAGNTSYTSTPCPIDESTSRISKSATAVASLDCRIGRQLAIRTAHRMKQGEDSGSVYDSYGGINNLAPETIGLISYVYTFKGNESASNARIAALATDRCKIGSFGPSAHRCEAYPYGLIDELGGCDVAQGKAIAVQQTARYTDPRFSSPGTASYAPPDLGKALPSASASNPNYPRSNSETNLNSSDSGYEASGASAHDQCRDRLARSIDNTVTAMHEAQSAQRQDNLRERHRQLRYQQSRC